MYTKMYHYIYIIINMRRNMLYVGKHSTSNIEDGYFGSGTELNYQIHKYGSQEFTRYIIDFTDSEQHLKELEKYYICYFYEKFEGVFLNSKISTKYIGSFIKESFNETKKPFWEYSYAFSPLVKFSEEDKEVPGRIMLGTFFISSIFDEGRKDLCCREYNWNDKNMLFLHNLKLDSKYDFWKMKFQWCFSGSLRIFTNDFPRQ